MGFVALFFILINIYKYIHIIFICNNPYIYGNLYYITTFILSYYFLFFVFRTIIFLLFLFYIEIPLPHGGGTSLQEISIIILEFIKLFINYIITLSSNFIKEIKCKKRRMLSHLSLMFIYSIPLRVFLLACLNSLGGVLLYPIFAIKITCVFTYTTIELWDKEHNILSYIIAIFVSLIISSLSV